MIDDNKELSINILLETAESEEKNKKFYEGEIWEPKRESFFDSEFLTEIREEIALAKHEGGGQNPPEKAKIVSWKRLTGLRRSLFWAWRILFKWQDFVGMNELDIVEVDAEEIRKIKQIHRPAIRQDAKPLEIEKAFKPPEFEVHVEETSPIQRILLKSGFRNWYLKFRKKIAASPYILSIDIQEGYTGFAVYYRSRIPRLEKFGILSVRRGEEEKGGQAAELLRKGIQKLQGELFLDMSDVYVSVGTIQVRSWTGKAPKVTKKESEQLAQFQIKKELGEETGEYQIDHAVLGRIEEQETEKTVVGYNAAKKNELRPIIDILKESSIHPIKVMGAGQALCAYLRRWENQDFDSVSAIIDMGIYSTTMYVIRYGTVGMSRNIPIGEESFIEAFIGSYPVGEKTIIIDRKKAEKICGQYGVPEIHNPLAGEEQITLGQLGKAVWPVVERFTMEINRTATHFKGQLSGMAFQKVFFTGPGSGILRLADVIGEEMGQEIQILSFPGDLILGSVASDESGLIASYPLLIHSIGAAASAFDEFNLIADEGRAGKSQTRAWAALAACGVLALIVAGSISLDVLGTKRQSMVKLDDVNTAFNNLEGSSRQYIVLMGRKNELALLGAEINSSLDAIEEQNVTSGILRLLSNMVPTGITLNKFEYLPGADSTGESGAVHIGGKIDPGYQGPAEELLLGFLVRIEKVPLFSRVELVESSEGEESGDDGSFELNCHLIPRHRELLQKKENNGSF